MSEDRFLDILHYNDFEFKDRFRLSKAQVRKLLEQIGWLDDHIWEAVASKYESHLTIPKIVE